MINVIIIFINLVTSQIIYQFSLIYQMNSVFLNYCCYLIQETSLFHLFTKLDFLKLFYQFMVILFIINYCFQLMIFNFLINFSY